MAVCYSQGMFTHGLRVQGERKHVRNREHADAAVRCCTIQRGVLGIFSSTFLLSRCASPSGPLLELSVHAPTLQL